MDNQKRKLFFVESSDFKVEKWGCEEPVGQDRDTVAVVLQEDKIYTQSEVDTKTKHPGGMAIFLKEYMVLLNEKYPEPRYECARVIVSFVIETDGTLSNLEVLRDPGYGAGRETLHIINTLSNWIPAKKGEKWVRSKLVLPITIEPN